MVRNFLKLNQTRYRVSHVYLECKTKRIFAIACVGKKLAFHTEICLLLFQINHFKKRCFSSGQGVVQAQPNWVWSIPWVPRV